MRALLSKTTGLEGLTLCEAPDPEPGPKQVMIQVKACGVNFPDLLMIEDRYQFKPPRPFAPGGEFSGVVAWAGEAVSSLQAGDRVIGGNRFGGAAELVAVDEDRVIVMPDSMDFEDGAALLTTFGTSQHALKDRARLQGGETLLVLGAAGGAGLSAVALGRAMGARVIAAVSTPEKAEFCKANGADEAVIYPRGPFDADQRKALAQLFKDAVGEAGAHVVYDAIGGAYAEAAFRALAWEGRFLVIGFAAGDIPRIPLNLVLLKHAEVLGVFWGEWARRNPERHRHNVAELMALYEAGKARPVISERYPLARGADAFARLANREALGKIVVQIG